MHKKWKWEVFLEVKKNFEKKKNFFSGKNPRKLLKIAWAAQKSCFFWGGGCSCPRQTCSPLQLTRAWAAAQPLRWTSTAATITTTAGWLTWLLWFQWLGEKLNESSSCRGNFSRLLVTLFANRPGFFLHSSKKKKNKKIAMINGEGIAAWPPWPIPLTCTLWKVCALYDIGKTTHAYALIFQQSQKRTKKKNSPRNVQKSFEFATWKSCGCRINEIFADNAKLMSWFQDSLALETKANQWVSVS